MKFSIRIITVMLAMVLSACGSFDKPQQDLLAKLTPYKATIVQGNVVTQEQANLLTVGMDKSEVAGILGTPLLINPLEPNRWDYVFTIKKKNAALKEQRLSLFFNDAVLQKVDSNNLLSEKEILTLINTDNTSTKTLPPMQASEEALSKFKTTANEKAAPAQPTRTIYPLLEDSV